MESKDTEKNIEENKENDEEYEENGEEENPEKNVKVNIDREFAEVDGGEYLENGFYVTPNGSFWDPDGVYFNRQGLDRHDGYYDTEYEYHPGRGWIPHLLCYESDVEDEEPKDGGIEEDDGLDYDNCDDLHEEVDYGNLAENKDKAECVIKPNILCFANRKK